MEVNQIALLQTDKSGCVGLLPLSEFRKRAEAALSTLFSYFDADLEKLKYIC